MANLKPLCREDLPRYEELFSAVEQQLGFVPNAYFALAHRPGILEAMQALMHQVTAGTVPRASRLLGGLQWEPGRHGGTDTV